MEKNEEQRAAREGAAATAESPAAARIAEDIREKMSSLQPHATDRVQQAADAVRQAAGSLRGEEDWAAQLIEQGAAKLTGLAETLRTNDLQTLLGKTEQFARSQPVLFAGAAMALGFALTRAASAAARTGAASQPSQEGGYVGD
jgi:hypothetical protein